MAWSHDSQRFLVVGNGHNSSVVVYELVYSNQDESVPQLREAWRVRAGQSPEHHDGNTREENGGKAQAAQKPLAPSSVVNSKDSGLEYQYGDAFYMAEINPSGNVFAVEERPHKSTLARLYSPSGGLLKTSELNVPTSTSPPAADAGGLVVQTLLISTYKGGLYALVVQGGYVLFVDAEQLSITNSFKAVGRL